MVANAIKPCGFYLRKAHQLKEIARIVIEDWHGIVPKDEEKLLSLPGVGIKTASLVMNISFGMDATPALMRQRARQIFDKVDMALKTTDANMGISMGGVIAEPETNFNQLYERADKALYEAKNQGRGRLVLS